MKFYILISLQVLKLQMFGFRRIVFLNSQIKNEIQNTMKIINSALKKVPQDKAFIYTSRINQTLSKYRQKLNDETHLPSFLQELQFNLNFIKLSNPNIDYSFVQQEDEDNKTKSQQKKEDSQMEKDEISLQGFSQKVVDQYNQRAKKARQQVDFSNWSAGNADPQDMRRHKQLIARQHFGGDYWKNKQKPVNVAQEQFRQYVENLPKPDKMPQKTQTLESEDPVFDERDEYWQKVKR